jgi:exosortase
LADTLASSMSSNTITPPRTLTPAAMLLLGAFGIGLLWAYWPVFATMAGHWLNDPQYSHGILVPVFALFLLWWRRDLLVDVDFQPNYWGLPVLLGGIACRLLGTYYFYVWAEQVSLLPCLAGICLLFGGWPVLRWAWPSIAFLMFMIPLPFFIETALARELRLAATSSSVYVIQTIGIPALAEGTNIIQDGYPPIQVAPACCGIGMLLTFFALAAAIILLTKQPWIDKLVMVISAVPIAILANIIRVTATAILFRLSAGEAAHKLIHDWAGYLMMPVGLVILWLELKILDHLFIIEGKGPGDLDSSASHLREHIKAASPFQAGKPT